MHVSSAYRLTSENGSSDKLSKKVKLPIFLPLNSLLELLLPGSSS
jgi:hypothetical protein